MPHVRIRHIHSLLNQTLKYSPIVGLFGHRQVGKTTLVESFSKVYTTLDDRALLTMAVNDPRAFLHQHQARPLIIDECQYAPALFPALKEWVRLRKEPGQFLLTGSVRFSSRKVIRESLTGRIITHELLPMDLSETYEYPLPKNLKRLLQAKSLELDFSVNQIVTEKSMRRYLNQGGLPGAFAIRSPRILKDYFRTNLETILERDLRLLQETSLSYSTLLRLLSTLAQTQGEPTEMTTLSRKTRISRPTLSKILRTFESLFLIRRIETEGGQKRPIFFLEDQGEATSLLGETGDDLFHLTRFLYANLRTQAHYSPDGPIEIFQYRTKNQSFIPLCFRSGSNLLGVIPSLETEPSPSILGSAQSFLKKYPHSKVVIVCPGNVDRIYSRSLRVLPMNCLL